jgi:hypothetical protein
VDLVSVFYRQIPCFPSNIFEEAAFSPLYVFDTFVKNKGGISGWIHIQVFYSVPLVFISIHVSVPVWFYCYGSVV